MRQNWSFSKDTCLRLLKRFLIYFILTLFFLLFLCMCAFLHEFMHVMFVLVPTETRRVSDTLELKLPEASSCLVWVLGTKPRCPAQAVIVLSHGAFSLAIIQATLTYTSHIRNKIKKDTAEAWVRSPLRSVSDHHFLLRYPFFINLQIIRILILVPERWLSR